MTDILISATLKDVAGRSRNAHLMLPSATSEANTVAAAQAWLPLLDAVSGGLIEGCTYQKPVTLPGGLKGAATAGIDNRVGANFQFVTTGRYNFGVWIPGWLTALYTADDVDLVGAGVAAFYGGYATGFAGQLPTNGHAEDLVALNKAKKSIRK